MRQLSRLAPVIFLCSLSASLRAEIISSALFSFPAKTELVEYDDLYTLRRLPNYAALRQRFAGKLLDDAKLALTKLDIPESQVHEIVMGTSPDAFYGLVSGTFSGAVAKRYAKKAGIWPHLVEGEQSFCPKGTSTCIVFLEDSLAAFGSLSQLKLIHDTRLGSVARLGSNKSLSSLMNGTELKAPVRGVVYGSQLNTVIADALQDESGLNMDWKPFSSNIKAFGYSVSMDTKAHVVAKLECKSANMAGVLRQMLGALSGVQSLSTKVGRNPDTMPFQNLQVSSSGDLVDLKMDTPIPSS